MTTRDVRRKRKAGIARDVSSGAFCSGNELQKARRTCSENPGRRGLQKEMPRPRPVPRHKVGPPAPNRPEFPAHLRTIHYITEIRDVCGSVSVDTSSNHQIMSNAPKLPLS